MPLNVIKVSIKNQQLELYDSTAQLVKRFPVSTSRFGVGNQSGSFKTPTGHHQICEKIGDGLSLDEVFVGRQPQGRLSILQQQQAELPEDIITARILRLSGMQPGINSGPEIDSYERYIYIHGTPEEDAISTPASHGCIRMRNQDIVELYDMVDLNDDVLIEE